MTQDEQLILDQHLQQQLQSACRVLYANGFSNKLISKLLGMSLRTVQQYNSKVSKTEVENASHFRPIRKTTLPRSNLSPARDDLIRRLHAQGWELEAIAQKTWKHQLIGGFSFAELMQEEENRRSFDRWKQQVKAIIADGGESE